MIRFQEALDAAIEFVKIHQPDLSKKVVLVRDLYGRIRIALPTLIDKQEQLARQFQETLGKFSPEPASVFLYEEDLFDPQAIFASPDQILIPNTTHIYLLDSYLTGREWLGEPPLEENDQHPPRVTLYGIKGGVGRSTALSVWAWDLAKAGQRVLVLDLDLESPGVSQILLPQSHLPDFGIVDWLIEDGVGQADDRLLMDLVSTSPLSGEGEIRVVPAVGAKERDYLAKLSRAYMDINKEGKPLRFAERLTTLLKILEAKEKPNIVLLDSRAGLHDIAAIAITHLDTYSLLFAGNTASTWHAYRLLFQHWQNWYPNVKNALKLRERLKIVAALVPETGRSAYLERCCQAAYDLFSGTCYEEDVGDSKEVFNFDINDPDAPHYPLTINWHRGFQEFDPLHHSPDDYLIQGSYGLFLKGATLFALGENEYE